MEIEEIATERVDDLPILLKHIERMGLPELLDESFPAHGNWLGLSLGEVAWVWLTHLSSEGDHRLSYVRPWAEARLETLRSLVDPDLEGLDFADDRLATLLRRLSRDDEWIAFESALNRRLIRVYDLDGEKRESGSAEEGLTPIRIDGTTASGHAPVTEEGLLQFGFSKDHRPDLGQIKIMMATLDPWAVPLVALVVSGESADDPLYLPVIERVRESLSGSGRLYVGDCKLASISTRSSLARSGDFYLAPLSEVSWSERADDLAMLRDASSETETIYRGEERIAEGKETATTREIESEGVRVVWTERRLIVRSFAFAEAQEKALSERLRKALETLAAMSERKKGKRRPKTAEEARAAIEAILKRLDIEGLIEVEIVERETKRERRPYRDRPARILIERDFDVTASVNETAIEARRATLGVRAYATNAPSDRLSLSQAVEAYRHEYRIERGFERLKGKPLSLTPFYLQREDHLKGLTRFLTLALRVLTLLESVARRALKREGESLQGLLAGQPSRKTERPTAESLLRAFKGLHLTLIRLADGVLPHSTPLSSLQLQILRLLDFPDSIFHFSFSRSRIREP